MERIKRSLKNNKWLARVIAAMVCVVFAFTGMAALYFHKFDSTLEKENEVHLAEVAGQITAHTNSILEGTKTGLEVAADAVGSLDKENISLFLSETEKTMGFVYMGYAGTDGILYTDNGLAPEDVSREEYFISALQGKTVITDLHRKILWDKAVSGVLAAAAVHDADGQITGVLTAMIDIKSLQNVLNVESFNGNGFAYLVDAEGELVLRSKSMDYNNFFLLLQNVSFEKNYSYDAVLTDMKNERQGIALFNNMGISQYAYYYPLGVNGWMVVNIVAKSAVTANTASLTRELAFLSVVSIAVFTALIVIAVILYGISESRKHTAEVKTIFLANMSHELRTPMNAIIGAGEILRREDLTQKQAAYVHTITASGKSLLKIINDILDFSKFESGKLTLSNEPYELRTLMVDITELTVLRIGSKPVRFIVDMDTEIPEKLTGDVTRVKQILVNLLGNAVKFTKEGFIRLTFSAQKNEKGVKLSLAVSDTGEGIRKQDMEQLFISFNQIDTHHHSTEGTGLGLAIAKNLAQQMGGDITVESVYGAGTTFTAVIYQETAGEGLLYQPVLFCGERIALCESDSGIREYCHQVMERSGILHSIYETPSEMWRGVEGTSFQYIIADRRILEAAPRPLGGETKLILLCHQNDPDIPVQELGLRALYEPLFCLELMDMLCAKTFRRGETAEAFDAKNTASYETARILIVDDNTFNQEITEALLEPYHMKIDKAENGRKAVEAVQTKDYDLVFMDHMMPIMDGVEALNCIRSLPESKFHTLPIVVLTANATREAQAMFLNAGFQDFLAKPIEPERLDAILRKYLG